MASLVDILGWRSISTSIQAVESGVPNRLPPALMNTKEDVLGDRTTFVTYYGQRQTPKQAAYGSQSKARTLRPLGEKSVSLLHFPEHIKIRQELLARLRNPNDSLAQTMAQTEIARHGADFRQLFDNGRIVAITSVLANAGKIWLDSSGNILPTSSGASLTIDPGVHANNQTQLNGIIDASWATASTNIIQHITNIKIQARKNTGREIKHAFYGKNIANYLFSNTTLKAYWQYNTKMFEALTASPDMVPQGFAGLQWHFMGDSFYNDSTDTTQSIWGDDAITFAPDINPNTYTLFEGSNAVPVVGAGTVEGSLIAATGQVQNVFGMGGYAIPEVDPVGIKVVYFDTHLPVLKTAAVNGTGAGDWFFADVTP